MKQYQEKHNLGKLLKGMPDILGVRRLFFPGEGKVFQGDKTYYLPKKHLKTYYFPLKKSKNILFWPPFALSCGHVVHILTEKNQINFFNEENLDIFT